MGRREALFAVQDIPAGGETARGHGRRHHACFRGPARMKRLAVGAELAFQPRCHGTGDAKRARHRIRIQPQQAPAGRRGTKGSRRCGRMKPHGVMPRHDQRPDPTRGLIARNKCRQNIRTGCARPLCQRQQSTCHGNGRMARKGHVHIIIVVGMARRAVDQRRLPGGQAQPATDKGRLRIAALVLGFRRQYIDTWLICSGQGNAEPVKQTLAGNRPRVVVDVVELQPGGHCRQGRRHLGAGHGIPVRRRTG